MKKLLSISFCLMICLTSIFVFGACKEKPKKISEVEATAILTTAMETLAESKYLKVNLEYPEMYTEEMQQIFDIDMIATESMSYIKLNIMGISSETWTLQEQGVWTEYLKTSDWFSSGEYIYQKFVMESMESFLENETLEENFDGLDFDKTTFIEATTLKGEVEIVFNDDGTKVTAKIVDGKLVAIQTIEEGMTMTVHLHYDDFTSEIPPIPQESESVQWKMVSKIIVEGVDTELEQGESIDLSTAVLKFYPNFELDEDDFVVVDLSKASVTHDEINKKVIVKYLGLTYEIQYTNGNNISLTENEISSLIDQVLTNMANQTEIKEESTSLFGNNIRITTQNKSYRYKDEETIEWIVKDVDNWHFYELDMNDYTMYDINIPDNDVRKYVYVQSSSNFIKSYEFVEAVYDGEEYQIKYQSGSNNKFTLIIKNNLIDSIIYDGFIDSTTTFTYYNVETNNIPNVYDLPWEYGGVYIEM